MIDGSLSSLYEGLACQEVFSRSTFLPFRFERLAQAQFCIEGTAGPPCLAALSVQPPEPGGSRRKARGVDGESACRATMVSGHYAATRTCVPATDPLVEGSDYVCSIDPKAEPVRYATLAASTYIRSGGTPYQDPSCNSARAQ